MVTPEEEVRANKYLCTAKLVELNCPHFFANIFFDTFVKNKLGLSHIPSPGVLGFEAALTIHLNVSIVSRNLHPEESQHVVLPIRHPLRRFGQSKVARCPRTARLFTSQECRLTPATANDHRRHADCSEGSTVSSPVPSPTAPRQPTIERHQTWAPVRYRNDRDFSSPMITAPMT